MRVALPVKAVGQRFAVPILVLASTAMIVLGKADALLFDRVRAMADDVAAPILHVAAQPLAAIDAASERLHDVLALYNENARLREENARLLQWQQAAQSLKVENTRLRELVKLTPEPAVSFISGRVVANSGGSFLRSVMVDTGLRNGVARGQAAITGEGLVGRVTEVGDRAARILLLTDLNSRIPVALDGSRDRAVLAGDNSEQPRLLYLPPRAKVQIGDRVVTSGYGGIFPPGLPVGIVAAVEDGIVRIAPFAELAQLDYLRIVDYGLGGVLPQPVPPRPAKPGKGDKHEATP